MSEQEENGQEETRQSEKQSHSGNEEKASYQSRYGDLSATLRKLRKIKRASEEEEAAYYAKELNLPYLDLNIFPISPNDIDIIPEEEARRAHVVVIRRLDRELMLGALDPTKKEVQKIIRRLSEKEGFQVRVFVVSQSSLEEAWENYKKKNLVDVFDYLRLQLKGEDLERFERDIRDIMDLGKRIKEISTTKLLDIIIAGAIKLDASDIHLEPEKDGVTIRYRIDGVLHKVTTLPSDVYPHIVSRIKILSKMLLNVHDIPQDGRFSIGISGEDKLDVRASVLPGNYGENVVLRLLNRDISQFNLEKLGLTGKNYEWLLREVQKKQGMIINSGPTGSGKTTTLYALINKINSEDKKIISIEDPIEYQVPGVRQTQVDKKRGYTFASGLRSIVRQDPDVILVGEIRDDETAAIAIDAALTGHLVLTTVHANTSAGVVSRLFDLSIKPDSIASAVNVIIAQRLVRTLCPYCKEKYKPAPETVDNLKKMLSLISPKAQIEIPREIKYLWKAKGCLKCKGFGYKGRVGIFEVMPIDKRIKKLIEAMASADEIRQAALENGLITYEQDGILKAITGQTSLAEVQRVAGHGDYLLKLYEQIVIQTLARGIEIPEKIIESIEKIKGDYQALKKVVQEAGSRDKIKYILATGLILRAGDIHIEPGEHTFKIRYRIDGILHDLVELSMSEFLTVLNEIKSLLGVEIEKREGVLDGRFRIILSKKNTEFKPENIDVRVSIILGGFGDIVVMRLLNQRTQNIDLDKLGLRKYNVQKLKRNIFKPDGIVLNTGPTGSGKTTTLYSALKAIYKPELKIITVEDPIEYRLEGIIQTQINEKEGYTFSTALRSLLRQNPDVIMIGEIRDEETAQIAYQAALTGHLVLSTLHTNNAAGSVRRLVNMGVSLDDVASGSNCFMAQRLVRKLCPYCKKEIKPSPTERELIEKIISSISPATKIKISKLEKIYQPVGCPHCNYLGYQGQLPISEVLEVDEEMEKFITTDPTTSELYEKAIQKGMLSLSQDGVLRVVEGITTLEEISRVSEDVYLEGLKKGN